MEVKVKKKGKRPQTKEGVAVSRPQMREDQKALKAIGKTKAIESCYDAFFNEKVNVDEMAMDQTRPAFARGMAQMAIKFLETGDVNIAEKVCGIVGVSTKAKEIDHTVTAGTYTDFLNDLKARHDK